MGDAIYVLPKSIAYPSHVCMTSSAALLARLAASPVLHQHTCVVALRAPAPGGGGWAGLGETAQDFWEHRRPNNTNWMFELITMHKHQYFFASETYYHKYVEHRDGRIMSILSSIFVDGSKKDGLR